MPDVEAFVAAIQTATPDDIRASSRRRRVRWGGAVACGARRVGEIQANWGARSWKGSQGEAPDLWKRSDLTNGVYPPLSLLFI